MRIFVCLLLSCFAAFACANENEEAMKRFTLIMADEETRQQAYEAGRERSIFCGYCHGENGNSKRPHIPNLASQNPIYLFHAFEQFARGERVDYVMSSLAKNLTLEDRVNIAVYFSQQKVLPITVVGDEALSRRGGELFTRTCMACHGEQGQGKETMPRLAGQPSEYIRKALTRFRNNDPARAGSVMLGIASQLSDEDIEALAIFLPQLRPSERLEKQSMDKLTGMVQ